MALAVFDESLGMGRVKSARELFELFAERLRPEQKAIPDMARDAKTMLDGMAGSGKMDSLALLAPGAKDNDLNDIAYVLVKSGAASRCLEDIAKKDVAAAKGLFRALKTIDMSEAHRIIRQFIRHPDARIRAEALEGFSPERDEEIEEVFEIYAGEPDWLIKKRLIAILLKTRSRAVIERLFLKLERGFFTRQFLMEFIRLCGELKIEESLECLAKVFSRRPFFNMVWANEPRVNAIVSLARLSTPAAASYVEKALGDRSRAVRRMAQFVKGQG